MSGFGESASAFRRGLKGLRRELKLAGLIYLVCLGVAGVLSDDLLVLWRLPFLSVWPGPKEPFSLYGVMDLFFVKLKLCLLAALLFCLPYLAWRAARPRLVHPGWIWGALACLVAGPLTAWLALAPLVWRFLIGYSLNGDGLLLSGPPDTQDSLQVALTGYTSLMIRLLLGGALVFFLPYLLVLLARIGLLDPAALARRRGLALCVVAVLAALLSPELTLTLALIAPLYLLFELSLALARRAARAAKKGA